MSKATRLYQFLHGMTQKTTYPSVINFDITSKCNLYCEHCYWRKNYDPAGEFTDSEWEEIFKDFYSKGAHSAFLTGGEPSLRLKVIESAYQIFDTITIVSNGTIRIPEEIQTRIFISIDGPKEIHEKIRGRNVFDSIMTNIKNDKRVVLTPTLSTTNYHYIEDLVQIARESNVDGITFSTYAANDKETDKLLLRGEELDWTVNKLEEIWRKNKDIVFLSPKIIKLFKSKKFYKNCYLRNQTKEISYDAQLKQKEPCVLGEGVDCSTCGCIVPIVAYAMSRIDVRAWLLFDKLFSERYY
ncbi:MAG: radical SAM protein [Spirochaetales bacterium]|nr:radical SAM protein [Spirochaetales bacterium]